MTSQRPVVRGVVGVGLLCSLLAWAGCGDGDGDDATNTPAIAQLMYTPSTVPVGQTTVVSGTFGFTDADGDVATLAIDLVLPSGAHQPLGTVLIEDVAGQTAATVNFQFMVTSPEPANFGFEVWLIDREGHESNHLAGDLTAT